VGTFEIRKNYSLLIDVWHDLVANDQFDLDLVIVGRLGWCVDDVVGKLYGSQLFQTRIFWMQGISDGALSWLYESCHVFLFPSLYEGWGLPVIEALQHGRPVIASNRGAVPEAALGVAHLIDPDDHDAWHGAILTAAKSPRRDINVWNIPSWDDTAAVMKKQLFDLRDSTETAA